MKKYYTYTVKKLITVQHLVTIEYLEFKDDFCYPEESHPFYEFVYVEQGGIKCKTENGDIDLHKNDFYLITPDTSHSYYLDQTDSATVLVVCFKSKSNIISAVSGKRSLAEQEKELVKRILSEARATFSFPFDEKLTLSQTPRPGSQQLIENYIEEVLIKFVQTETYKNQNIQIATNADDVKKSVTEEIVGILEDNIYSKITLSDICRQMFYSKTYLNCAFKQLKGVTIMQYYQDLKIKEAKALLNKNESISHISENLCFESPQYFAKAFKTKVGKTPTEYKKEPIK